MARINSIERKGIERGIVVTENNIDWSLLDSGYEKQLAIQISLYPTILQQAAEKRDSSALVTYLLDLAKCFSRFYRECPVLNAETEELIQARLAMCGAARDVLTDGLNTLTIQVPEAM